eukprot:278527_1
MALSQEIEVVHSELSDIHSQLDALEHYGLNSNHGLDDVKENLYSGVTNVTRVMTGSVSSTFQGIWQVANDVTSTVVAESTNAINTTANVLSNAMSTHHHDEKHSTSTVTPVHTKRMIADTYYDITQAMIKSIDASKKQASSFPLLATLTYIEGTDKIDENDFYDENYWWNIDQSKFEIVLDVDYDQWMLNKAQYQNRFIGEISRVLKIEPEKITIDNYRRGSTKFTIIIADVWLWYKHNFNTVNRTAVPNQYIRSMRTQDQISVKYKDRWYAATIITVLDDGSATGKKFKVRFNPLDNNDGKVPFWLNIEWFSCRLEAARLRFPGQLIFNMRNIQGENIQIPWRPPALAQRNNAQQIQVNDHIFVKWGVGDWRRSFVYKKVRVNQGFRIHVTDLLKGKTRIMDLWMNVNTNKISFVDRR